MFNFCLLGTMASLPGCSMCGLVYVFFGHHNATYPDIDLSSSTPYHGFRIVGPTVNDLFGTTISAAGDFNGDGFHDFMIGGKTK